MSDNNEPLHQQVHRHVVEAQQSDRDARNRGPYPSRGGRSSFRSICAVLGIPIGAFSCTKLPGPMIVVGAVAGLFIGYALGWLTERGLRFLIDRIEYGFYKLKDVLRRR